MPAMAVSFLIIITTKPSTLVDKKNIKKLKGSVSRSVALTDI